MSNEFDYDLGHKPILKQYDIVNSTQELEMWRSKAKDESVGYYEQFIKYCKQKYFSEKSRQFCINSLN